VNPTINNIVIPECLIPNKKNNNQTVDFYIRIYLVPMHISYELKGLKMMRVKPRQL